MSDTPSTHMYLWFLILSGWLAHVAIQWWAPDLAAGLTLAIAPVYLIASAYYIWRGK